MARHAFDNLKNITPAQRVIAMSTNSFLNRLTSVISVLVMALVLLTPTVSAAKADKVTTVQNAKGWKLKVNGADYFIKGMVWGYSPRGQNYTYNLWGESDDFIRKVLDYEFGLMQAMGVNTIRTFSTIPPRWITYIYREYGIMSVVNPLMGRYGYNVGGTWVPNTDYSDLRTRETIKRDMVEIVRKYKDVPGVLMFAFGNENNYGLSWSSFEIENLPEGEQNAAKARYLYSLFNEVIRDGKEIDQNHPFSIVNGDIQYIDLIAELVPDMDVLGSNVYRGPSFTALWADVKAKLDVPVVFFEFGSDAFNARDFKEDQRAQANILKQQWLEIYNKAAGKGEEGNAVGAFVFEWRDEWWKYKQTENLSVHDKNASWSNQGYLFDWAEGKNNMNEEWFGINALGLRNADGVYTARPRMAYDVLADVFAINPYGTRKREINNTFANANMELYALRGDVRRLKAVEDEANRKLQFTGGEIRGEMALRGYDQDLEEDGRNGQEFSDGQMLFLDFAFQPTQNITGQFSVNVLANVANKRPFEYTYGDRGSPVTVVTRDGNTGAVNETTVRDSERVEIYDFNAKYQGEHVDIEAFYHIPRFHWGYEGDHFGLMRETTDIPSIDVFNGKAPEGVEIAGKGKWAGAKLVVGPEIYWGANPKAMFKYNHTVNSVDLAFIHAEDLARLDDGANATQSTERQSRQTTLTAETVLADGIKLEMGGIMSATEKVDESYDRVNDNGDVILDQIGFEDTLGFKTKVSFPLLGTQTYLSAHYAGLVADGGQHHKVYGVTDPSRLPYSGLGNKHEYEAGMRIFFGDFMLFPRVMYRENLVDANPDIAPSINNGILSPGTNPRDSDTDPFAVLGNREARSAELYLTYDPTPATPFYDWDNEWREDAFFAFDIGGTYTTFPTATDAHLFFNEQTSSNASFGRGLPAEDVWAVSSRMAFNLGENGKYIARMVRGFDQPTGDPNGGTRDYYELHGKAVIGRHIISGYFKKDSWGDQDFFRQFNITYPEQFKLDYAFLLSENGQITDRVSETSASKIGLRGIYRTFDENSLDIEHQNGRNDYGFLTVLYFNYKF